MTQSTLWICAATLIPTSQKARQTGEYKRLSEATQRAFAFPNSPALVVDYTNKPTGSANSGSRQV